MFDTAMNIESVDEQSLICSNDTTVQECKLHCLCYLIELNVPYINIPLQLKIFFIRRIIDNTLLNSKVYLSS